MNFVINWNMLKHKQKNALIFIFLWLTVLQVATKLGIWRELGHFQPVKSAPETAPIFEKSTPWWLERGQGDKISNNFKLPNQSKFTTASKIVKVVNALYSEYWVSAFIFENFVRDEQFWGNYVTQKSLLSLKSWTKWCIII